MTTMLIILGIVMLLLLAREFIRVVGICAGMRAMNEDNDLSPASHRRHPGVWQQTLKRYTKQS